MSDVDVVVIGTGAGGAPVAWTLAKAGVSVLLIDRGPRYTTKDFIHDEVHVAGRGFFMPLSSTDPHVLVADGREPERTAEGWVSVCVGGGTVHMGGFFYRFHPVDFRVREFLGPLAGAEHVDWPIDYETLRPYYVKVEQEMGISGPSQEGPGAAPREGPYPMPPVDSHPAVALIDAGAKKLGMTAFDTPRAIITKPFRGRGQCVYCHLCGGYGCEVGAKSSTLDTLIPEAEATGKCTVLPKAMVTQIETDASGKATGIIYRDAQGQDQRVKARVVVVACSAIESVRLLLMSMSARFPQGLGNDQGQIGAHLIFSTLAKAHGSMSFAKDAARSTMLQDHAPFLGRSILDTYLPKNAPVKKAGALNFLFPPGGPIYQSQQVARGEGGPIVWGKDLKARLKEYWHEQRQLDCETFGEYLPTPGTRVELDPEVVDQFGLPAARMVIDRHPHDLKVSQYLADRAADVLEAAGADKVWKSNIGGRTMHLPMGCLRMGNDPKSSAVDKNCKVHGVPNVFVSDGSVFPSSAGVPPTFTILANSMRVGDGIVKALAAKEL